MAKRKRKTMSNATACDLGCKWIVFRWTSLAKEEREFAEYDPKQTEYRATANISGAARFFTHAGAYAAREMCPVSAFHMPWSVLSLDELGKETPEAGAIEDGDEDATAMPWGAHHLA